jgi:hypothetical protein
LGFGAAHNIYTHAYPDLGLGFSLPNMVFSQKISLPFPSVPPSHLNADNTLLMGGRSWWPALMSLVLPF